MIRRIMDKRKDRALKRKALKVIEGMCVGSATTNRVAVACYKFAHVALGECPHPDWENELNKTYRQLKRHGVI